MALALGGLHDMILLLEDEIVGVLEKNCEVHGILTWQHLVKEKSQLHKNGYRIRCLKCLHEKRWRNVPIICNVHGMLEEKDIGFKNQHVRCSICHRLSTNRKRNTDPVAKAARNARQKLLRNEDPQKYRDYTNKSRALKPKGHRIRDVLTIRGLSWEQYETLVKDHDGKCAICGMPETRKCSKNKGEILRLGIDHCHDTNTVRGLLCHNCNTGIGKFKDDIEVMFNAIHYLEYWKEKIG